MRTIRWCKTHDCAFAECLMVDKYHPIPDATRPVVDPSDPEDVKGFLTSLGFKRQRGAKDGFDGWNDSIHRWVGPWEPVE